MITKEQQARYPHLYTSPAFFSAAEWKRTKLPQQRLCRDGYTKRGGTPTDIVVRLAGEKIWRRVYTLCFGTGVTQIIYVRGDAMVIPGGAPKYDADGEF